MSTDGKIPPENKISIEQSIQIDRQKPSNGSKLGRPHFPVFPNQFPHSIAKMENAIKRTTNLISF
jgi:hypothetical protein